MSASAEAVGAVGAMGSGRPRLLAIMGSGETAPTMAKVHRDLIDRMGAAPVPAVMLDTPFGFQENADILVAKALGYFTESVQRPVELASFRASAEIGSVAHEETLLRLRAAAYIFAGPGSPSYALRQWSGSQVPDLLAMKLRDGGCVTFASAAAITLGRFALPIYEVYKVGEEPRWLPGLDLVATAGLAAVVIPHFNNTEGANHDTRYCYMGERRLSMLEATLPDDVFVLGVDEHTACIIDINDGTATVAGIGSVTVRRDGAMTSFGPGDIVSLAELGAPPTAATGGAAVPSSPSPAGSATSQGPLLDSVTECERNFDAAISAGDARAATGAVLELEATLGSWDGDTTQSDHGDQARAILRSLVVRLGDAATSGLRDPAEVVAPFVEALIVARDRARADRRWDESDSLRDRLVEAGVEIHDTPDGTKWTLS